MPAGDSGFRGCFRNYLQGFENKLGEGWGVLIKSSLGDEPDRAASCEIEPGNRDGTSTPTPISFMGFTIPIVRRRGVILCKGLGKNCSFPCSIIGIWELSRKLSLEFPGLKIQTWGTRRFELPLSPLILKIDIPSTDFARATIDFSGVVMGMSHAIEQGFHGVEQVF